MDVCVEDVFVVIDYVGFGDIWIGGYGFGGMIV